MEGYTLHEIEWWITNAEVGAVLIFKLPKRFTHLTTKNGFRELAQADAGFAHSYELLKRSEDAKLVELTYKAGHMFVEKSPRLNSVSITEDEQDVIDSIEFGGSSATSLGAT